MAIEILEKALEKACGESVSKLRSRTLEENRRLAEKKHGLLARFVSYFPFIGRGNVLRNRLVTHEEVEKRLDEALRDE